MYSRNKFRAYLSKLEITEITLKSYMRDAAQFCKHMNDNGISEISSITKQEIDEYCTTLIANGQAVVSVQRKIASLKKLFIFLLKSELIDENPILGVRVQNSRKVRDRKSVV